MDSFHVYKDMEARTKGEIYLGVVGPVRTGKSTFIKRFMELLVLPSMENEADRNVSRDELPQSAAEIHPQGRGTDSARGRDLGKNPPD